MSTKLFYWITEREIEIIRKKQAQDKNENDLSGFMINFFKESVMATKRNESSLLLQNKCKNKDVDKIKLQFNEKYKRSHAKKKVLVLYGNALFDGLIWAAKFQTCINKKSGKTIFKSVDEWLSGLIHNYINDIEAEIYNNEIEEDCKKSLELLKKENKN